MSRMVDADQVIAAMRIQAGCANCMNYNGVRCRACDWDDAMDIVDRYAEETHDEGKDS